MLRCVYAFVPCRDREVVGALQPRKTLLEINNQLQPAEVEATRAWYQFFSAVSENSFVVMCVCACVCACMGCACRCRLGVTDKKQRRGRGSTSGIYSVRR